MKEKGSSLYFAVVVLSVISGVVIGISSLLIGQVKIIRGMGNSVVAIYIADTGIEHILKEVRIDNNISDVSGTVVFPGGASGDYQAELIPAGPNCDALYFCIESVGKFQEAKRAIEIKF
jgi:hypothetical protein